MRCAILAGRVCDTARTAHTASLYMHSAFVPPTCVCLQLACARMHAHYAYYKHYVQHIHYTYIIYNICITYIMHITNIVYSTYTAEVMSQ